VPTAELQSQWLSSLQRDLPKARRGALGNGRSDSLDQVDILVAIVHSASNRETLRSHKAGLIIADECHRYAAPMFTGALQEGYAWRLGLTATYERADGEHENLLTPYFGGVVYNLWYDRALKDEVIAPFDIALVGVDLTLQNRPIMTSSPARCRRRPAIWSPMRASPGALSTSSSPRSARLRLRTHPAGKQHWPGSI
jgi:RNA polymerase primary sigma factor